MMNQITITKRDGTREPFDADQINRSIARACEGLPEAQALAIQIATETHLTLYDGMTTEEMDQATIDAAVQNIQYDPAFDKAATRLLLKVVYKRALGNYETQQELKKLSREKFADYLDKGIELGFIDPRMKERFAVDRLAEAIQLERDDLFAYTGLDTLLKRYCLRDRSGYSIEPPQYFFMRIAMGLSLNEEDPSEWAIRFYEKMSRHEYIAGGSTNIGAGTTNPKLSNCFLLDMDDSMEHIAKTVQDVLLISKATGGIGMTASRLRADGSPLGQSNATSSGPIPFLHTVDSAVHSVIRAGKKMGALCAYIEPWHKDILEFLDLRETNGDPYRRTRTSNTAVFLPDEFMRRVESGESWYLFDPKETPDLVDLYGEAFSKRYQEYCEKADRGEMFLWDKMTAKELYRRIIVSLQTTGHPWITWKDAINERALNNHTGTITSSNLCTEITLPHDKDTTAVCNLISINLARHIRSGAIEWQKLEQSVRLAIRQLDNLIDINQLPTEEAKRSDRDSRAVGMGVMGLADVFEQLGLPYESEEAYNVADQVFEFVSYMAIDESAQLATERGSFPTFEGSGWSKGMVPIDTLATLSKSRGREVAVDSESHHRGLDWNLLREKVKRGMRNATVMAVAPNANIGLVAGTSPGMDPRFAQLFSRSKYSGKYMEVNRNLVHALKARGLWDSTRNQLLEHHGDLDSIEEIPEDIKQVYKTSFNISPYAFIEVAARAQKWIDQAISRNMYIAIRDTDAIMDVYARAWEKGLKTTYYLHMKPRHSAEQSTIKVNKASKLGKTGFRSAMASPTLGVEKEVASKGFAPVAPNEPKVPAPAHGFAAVKAEAEPKPVEEKAQILANTSKEIDATEQKASVPSGGFAAVAAAAPAAKEVHQQPANALNRYSDGTPEGNTKEVDKQHIAATCPVDPAERNQCDSCQ